MLLNKKDFFFSFIVYKENENGWNKFFFLPHSDMVLLLISYYTNQILILS